MKYSNLEIFTKSHSFRYGITDIINLQRICASYTSELFFKTQM